MIGSSPVLATTRFPSRGRGNSSARLARRLVSCVFAPSKRGALSARLTMRYPAAITQCRRIILSTFIRLSTVLLVLTAVTASATAQIHGQLIIPSQQQEWSQRTADRSPAATVARKSVTPAGYVGQTVPGLSQVSLEGVSDTVPDRTQQETGGESTAATTASKPAPFLDLTDEGLHAATAGTAEPTHTDMLIRLGTWTVIILCLCGLTALAIRRWQTKHGMLPVARGQSQIVETVVLGPNRSISLVELRGIQALVGCDASGIQSIVPVSPAFQDILDSEGPESTLSQSSNAHIESTA